MLCAQGWGRPYAFLRPEASGSMEPCLRLQALSPPSQGRVPGASMGSWWEGQDLALVRAGWCSRELAHRHRGGRRNFQGFGKGAPPRNQFPLWPDKLEPFRGLKHVPFGAHTWRLSIRDPTMSGHSKHLPYTHPHDGAKTHLPPQLSLPTVEPPVMMWMETQWTGREAYSGWELASWGLLPDSRGLPWVGQVRGQEQHKKLNIAEHLREKRPPRGQKGRRPQAPTPQPWNAAERAGQDPGSSCLQAAWTADDSHLQGDGPRGGTWPASLLLRLGSEDKVKGTPDHTQGGGARNNCSAFSVGRYGLTGPSSPRRTLRQLAPGACPCHDPAPGMRHSTQQGKQDESGLGLVGWLLPPGCLMTSHKAKSSSKRARPGVSPCRHLALGKVPRVSRTAPRSSGSASTRLLLATGQLGAVLGVQGSCLAQD